VALGQVSPQPRRYTSGNTGGIKPKWSPHMYPAIDPEVKKRLQAEARA
jgi:hypothetical protein